MGDSSERRLEERTVGRIVAQQFSAFVNPRVERLGAGWDHDLFLVDGEWVFRFPQRAERVPWLERELEIVRLVGPLLGGLVPDYQYVGSGSSDFPYPFVGYRLVKGKTADRTGPTPALARDIGRVLGRLHGVDQYAIEPTPEGWERRGPEQHGAAVVEHAALIWAALEGGEVSAELLQRVEPYLAGEVVPLRRPWSRFRLCHNDICAEHLVVDPTTGHLAGIVDWTDAMVTDPVVDFVGLITLGGYDFIEATLGAYPLDTDRSFRERLTWLARVLTLRWLGEAASFDRKTIPTKLVWLERAFADW